MKLLAILTSASFLLAVASASSIHHEARTISTRHSRLARDLSSASASRLTKRCKAKSTTKKHSSTSAGSKSTPKSTPKPAAHTTTKAPPKATPPPAPAQGVIAVTSCGPNGATAKITSTTGPNGSIDWLNRGIQGSGWNPCHVTVDQLIAVDLSTALKKSDSPFHACSQFLSLFTKYGNQFGVPPIILASFAMQESSCNPGAQGEGGEQGLMQITQDKCPGAPGGNCKDPEFNIKTGAKFFADTLNSNGGNVLQTVGEYNGWTPGMTEGQATAARKGPCCRCQNNLDYLDQFFNGWMQNVQGDNLGKFFNLRSCP